MSRIAHRHRQIPAVLVRIVGQIYLASMRTISDLRRWFLDPQPQKVLSLKLFGEQTPTNHGVRHYISRSGRRMADGTCEMKTLSFRLPIPPVFCFLFTVNQMYRVAPWIAGDRASVSGAFVVVCEQLAVGICELRSMGCGGV